MPFCPVCASVLEGHEAFCPHCRTPFSADVAETTEAESTAQWAPPGFDDAGPSGSDEDWTVALWGEREPTVVEERVPSRPAVVEETIPLASTTRRTRTAAPEWYKNRLVLALIALNVALLVLFILAALDRPDPVVLPPAVSVVPTAIVTTPLPTTNEIPEGERPAVSATLSVATPAPTPSPATAGNWTQVASLEGSGPMRGPVFELTGAEARLVHTVQGDQSASFTVFVVEEGHSLEQEGGTPVVNQQGAGSDETRLQRSAGRYYLDVNSANATWTLAVEELR